MTLPRLNVPSTGDILKELQDTLRSPDYTQRLNRIHSRYPNLKSEGRYRDALLEEFNMREFAMQHSLRAYAEADKIDMVITRPDTGKSEWIARRAEVSVRL